MVEIFLRDPLRFDATVKMRARTDRRSAHPGRCCAHGAPRRNRAR
jgi:hypothetical protein